MFTNVSLKRWFSSVAVSVGLLVSSHVSALTFGVFPQYQPVQLAELNAPLVNYLNETLSEPVYFRTADNFAAFKRAAEHQSYDILMIAPNLGYQLSIDGLYKPVMHVSYRPQAVFVVPKASKVKTFSDLKYKTIAFPPNLAITTKVAYKKMAEIGLQNADYQSVNRKSHLESFRWLVLGRSDAAALTASVWEALSEEERKGFRVLGLSDSTPGIFMLVKDPLWYEPVKSALMAFEQTRQGQAYFKTTKLLGYNLVTNKELAEIEALYR